MRFQSSKFPEADKSFRKPEKVLEWLQLQKAGWKWVSNATGAFHDEAKQSIIQPLNQKIADLSDALTKQPSSADSLAIDVLANLGARTDAQTWVPSTSRLGEYLAEISEYDESLALDILYVATRTPNANLPRNRRLTEAACRLSLFETAATKATAAIAHRQISEVKGQLNEVYDEFDQASEELLQRFSLATRNKERAYKRSRTLLKGWNARAKREAERKFERISAIYNNRLAERLKRADDEIAQFKDYYETKISLAEPVNYWARKSSAHSTATIFIGGLFICYTVIFLSVSYQVSIWFWEQIDDPISALASISVGAVTLIVFTVAISLIISRILYRLFLSQLHLWNDSSERVTMIKTYLAFAKRGHATDDHMAALMLRLYSPASDGVVKDDFGSSSAFESLVGKIGK